jgi:hypothetical protein
MPASGPTVYVRGATRKPPTYEIADVAADERAAGLLSRRYIGRVVHGDPVLIGELCGTTEQSCRGGYDPTVTRDSLNHFEQWSDTSELAPASNCHVRHLVSRKIEGGKRYIGVSEKCLGWFVQLVVGIERRENDARVQQQRAQAMASWPSPARPPHRRVVQPAAGACPSPPHGPRGVYAARSRRTLVALRCARCRDEPPQRRPRSGGRPASTP